jgi:hypothetical protein
VFVQGLGRSFRVVRAVVTQPRLLPRCLVASPELPLLRASLLCRLVAASSLCACGRQLVCRRSFAGCRSKRKRCGLMQCRQATQAWLHVCGVPRV